MFADHFLKVQYRSKITLYRHQNLAFMLVVCLDFHECNGTFIFAILQDLKVYESDPNGYVNAEHQWFDPKDAETKRTLTRTYLEALFQ